jgi:hypothetical protein
MFIGDANGADRALQQRLADRGYERVVVYAVTGMLRNNVGHWKVRSVDAPRGATLTGRRPEVSRFYGIVVSIFYDDHNPPAAKAGG